jgi:HemK-like putative methylase
MEAVSVVVTEPDVASGFDIDLLFGIPGDTSNESFHFDLPHAPIEVIKRYKDWCVLSVARGNGPRRVEEWILANESLCFEEPMLSFSRESKESSEQEDHLDEMAHSTSQAAKVVRQIVPVLANPHNAAYAHSLVLAPRHAALLKDIAYLRVIVHCLVKGYHKPGGAIELTSTIVGKNCCTRAICLEVVPSNSAGHISLVAAHNDVTGSTHVAPRQFQRHFQGAGWPILGATRDCYPFRGEKMCLSVVGLEFQVKGIENRQSISIAPVPKLRRVLEKEHRFWKEKQGVDDLQAESFNSEISKPIEYVNERAMFDGLEFRVTSDCMIPRQGSVALVDLVESHFSKKEGLGTRPSILDLGTGCGNLLVATLKRLVHMDATGVAFDASPEALAVCDYNIAAHGLKDVATSVRGQFADLSRLLHDRFDVVICNPPYIPDVGGRRKLDAVTMSFEPQMALFVNREAPNIHYEHVLEGLAAGRLLNPGAILVFEVCKENAEPILQLMLQHGFTHVEIGRDCKNCIRTVHGHYAVEL